MPELARQATGFDLVAANINAVCGDSIDFQSSKPHGIYCTQVILHSHENGNYIGINIPRKFLKYVTTKLIYLSKGDFVRKYRGSQDVVGIMLFKFGDLITCKELIKYIKTNQLIKLRN